MMKAAARIGAIVAVLACATAIGATPIPPPPTRWVTDNAGFLSPAARSALDQRLRDYEQQTGHQVIVWIGTSTGDDPIEDWTVRAFKAWRVGRKGLDDGLALFVFSADRKLRIEVGYGLEGVVPDAIASRIIREVIAPQIQAGDRDGAIAAGVDSIIRVIGGEGTGSRPAVGARGHSRRPLSPVQIIFGLIIGAAVLLLLITHPSLAMFLLYSIVSGGRGGGGGFGGGGGGGGFSGGGGRSGGGGASGSW
jgi:uncharacterized protein